MYENEHKVCQLSQCTKEVETLQEQLRESNLKLGQMPCERHKEITILQTSIDKLESNRKQVVLHVFQVCLFEKVVFLAITVYI